MFGELSQGASHDILVGFRELPAYAGAACGAEALAQRPQGGAQSPGRLEEDHRPGLPDQLPDRPAEVAGSAGEESFEAEAVAGQAGSHESRQHGRRSGNHRHGDSRFGGSNDEPVPRIRHRGHSRVRDDDHLPPRRGQFQKVGDPLILVVLVIGEDPASQAQAEAAGQGAKATRVLGGYHVGLLEFLPQARRGVVVVADGSGGENDPRVHNPTMPDYCPRRPKAATRIRQVDSPP